MSGTSDEIPNGPEIVRSVHGPPLTTSPIFQRPKDRSPSPYLNTIPPSEPSSPLNEPNEGTKSLASQWEILQPQQLTPAIGEEKDVKQAVAGPVLVAIPSKHMEWTRETNADPRRQGTPPVASGLPTPYVPPIPDAHLLNYIPGQHATAGPLPPPPRHITPPSVASPPPPRPPRRRDLSPNKAKGPREISPTKQASLKPPTPSITPQSSPSRPIPPSLHREESGSTYTTSSSEKGPSSSPQPELRKTQSRSPQIPVEAPLLPQEDDRTPTKTVLQKPKHVREGASSGPSSIRPSPNASPALPSRSELASSSERVEDNPKEPLGQTMGQLVAAIGEAIDDIGLMKSDEVAPPTVLEPPQSSKTLDKRPSGAELRRENSWVSVNSMEQRVIGDLSARRASTDTEQYSHPLQRSMSHSPPASNHRGPSPNKRFSRTPSLLSVSRFSITSQSKSRGPSPNSQPQPWPRTKRGVPELPDAMYTHDIRAMKNPSDRIKAYERKIKELGRWDSGLHDWIIHMKPHLAPQHHKTYAGFDDEPASPTLPSHFDKENWGQPRQISHGSIMSEATFPIRPDATSATDLSHRHDEDGSVPASPTISVPYPSLVPALNPRSSIYRSQTMGPSSPNSSTRLLSGNLKPLSSTILSSITRKSSTKKDRFPILTPNSPTSKLLPYRNQMPPPQPRPIEITRSPTIPGGPRSPPNRAQKTSSIFAPSRTSVDGSPEHRPLTRSPTRMNSLPLQSAAMILEDDEFNRQVDKLADLLPDADRNVLAGYLRRSGQDFLAIGQYLEDQKNGTIKTDLY